jgi:hypothetical protein
VNNEESGPKHQIWQTPGNHFNGSPISYTFARILSRIDQATDRRAFGQTSRTDLVPLARWRYSMAIPSPAMPASGTPDRRAAVRLGNKVFHRSRSASISAQDATNSPFIDLRLDLTFYSIKRTIE